VKDIYIYMNHLLLFDLNGTLCSKTESRNGKLGKARPFARWMLRNLMSSSFSIGIYSSAKERTVRALLKEHFSDIRFEVVLDRRHCDTPKRKKRDWDTVKPLRRHFGKRNVTLIDDSVDKAVSTERRQLLWIPDWDGSQKDSVLLKLYFMLVALEKMRLRDLNYMTAYVSHALFRTSNVQYNASALVKEDLSIAMCKLGETWLGSGIQSKECEIDEVTGEVVVLRRGFTQDERNEIVRELLS
jgi:hypothetical protein